MDGQVSWLGTVHPLLTLSFVSTWILPLHVVSSTLKRKSSSSVMDGLQRRKKEEKRSVTNMVTQLGWNILEHKKAKHKITMFHKIINNLANIFWHHQLEVCDSSTRGSVSHKFRQLSTKLNCYKYSFLPATIISCNTLPLDVRQLPSLEGVSTCVIHNLCTITFVSMIWDFVEYYIMLT